ncbi:glutathione S-transferase family protein [Hahella ganghwensis]|uniref:glutathione S-transferase family protein n=1 Tax=Hahella ganghwensis TaxID=286420 RepID=UPI00037BAAC8|nr:glutathione S-transferase family protein [Hahella ganghwensis]
MIKLFGFGKGLGLHDASPFVLKTHTFLRLAGLEYEAVARISNLQKAPKGKLPFIEDQGKKIADSSFIIDYLTEQYQVDLDSWLSTEQKAQAFMVARTLEEHFYWCLVWMRWVDPAGWNQICPIFFGGLPVPLKQIVPRVARAGVIKSTKAQGIGRHSRQEIHSIADKTLQHLSVFLADKVYLMGERSCSLDATGFGFLAQLILSEFESELCEMARGHDNLVDYCHRMQKELFSS